MVFSHSSRPGRRGHLQESIRRHERGPGRLRAAETGAAGAAVEVYGRDGDGEIAGALILHYVPPLEAGRPMPLDL